MLRALLHTGRRRLAEASPHDNLWGIGLKACAHHASSSGTRRGFDLLGQILEYARETLARETMPQIPDSLPPDTASHVNHPSDTVLELDPATRTRLNTAPAAEDPHNAILSALIDSVPDDHAPEVLLTYASHTDKALIPEQGLDVISGVVTIDDVTFTTLPSLTSGASTSLFRFRALRGTGSPQSFIHQRALDQMVATGAADESYVRSSTPRPWSGFGSQELLNTNRQARMTIQFYHNDTPSASLAVWMYIVPNKAMRCPLLLGRDSWMHFNSRSYQTLAPTHDGRIFGELTLSNTFDNAHNSAAGYIRSCEAPDAAYHLVYDGPGMSLTTAPQLVPVNLVRLDGSSAITGHDMVDIATTHNGQDPLGHFVASGRQIIPLTGHRDLEPGDILGTVSHPLLRIPLETSAPHDTQPNVTTIAESPATLAPPSTATNVTPDTSDDPPNKLLHRLDDVQRESFLRLWNAVPRHIRKMDFALDAPGWAPNAIDALGATLTEYTDIFSSSKLDYGTCSLRPFEIKVHHGTQPTQSHPYRLNPVLSKPVDAILDSYLAAGLIQHFASPWSSPLVCIPKTSCGIRITVNFQKQNKVSEIPQIATPRVDEVLDTLGGGSGFSVFDLFSGFTQLTIHSPGH